jgi:polo-like kinase 1
MIEGRKENSDIVLETITKPTGESEIRKYTKGRLLGKGGFAKCYEFTNMQTQKITAAKVIAKSSLIKSRSRQKLISEIKIHKALHHNNIVHFEHYFEDSENVYFLLELCQNQSLNELMKRRKTLTELEVQCYAVQIIKALKYLHSHRIIHRDLKLGNLFLTDKMELKVGDFGLATKLDFEGERKRTVCGTPNYIAPEILDGKTGHSYEVDIWSFGVILYTLIVGKPPFETNNVKETYKRIKMNNYSFPERAIISDSAKSLITEILVLDPMKRPTLDEILESDFFHLGISIPKLLPSATLACPPSLSYIRQFMPECGSNGICNSISNKRNRDDEIEDNKNNNNNNHIHGIGPEGITNPLTATSNSNAMIPSEVVVNKWIDYSTKYGLGYVLSNKNVGVLFNDFTKIIINPMGMNFMYIERKNNERIDIITQHSFNEEFNKDLQKKVTLIQHFKSYLLNEDKSNPIKKSESNNIQKDNLVYVKKWIRTKHAILFRLSNKIVQICFLDSTEIILKGESKMVTYINKKNEKLNYPLSTAMESDNKEMTKRLKYTKDILTHMLNSNSKH